MIRIAIGSFITAAATLYAQYEVPEITSWVLWGFAVVSPVLAALAFLHHHENRRAG